MLEVGNKRLSIYLHLTMDCNLRCRYCYSGEKRQDRMSLRVGKKAIDFFMDRSDDLVFRFFGGEPLLEFPLLKGIVAYSEAQALQRKKKVEHSIVTNGTLFTEEVADYCQRHWIGYSCTFDGTRQAQDANRVFPSGKGSFATVEHNIPFLLRCVPFVHIVRVVSPKNVAFLSDSVDYLLKKGFSNISLSPDYTHTRFRESLPHIKDEYLRLTDIYMDYLKRGKPIFLNIFEPGESLYHRGPCRLGDEEFSVDCFGNIYPCCCFADHEVYLLGHIDRGVEREKADIFLRQLRLLNQHIQEEHRDCPQTSFCKKGCGCTNIVTTGKLNEIDPVVCEYGRMEAEIRDSIIERLGNSTTYSI